MSRLIYSSQISGLVYIYSVLYPDSVFDILMLPALVLVACILCIQIPFSFLVS